MHQGIYCYQLLTVNNLLPGSILETIISLLVWDEETSISLLPKSGNILMLTFWLLTETSFQ